MKNQIFLSVIIPTLNSENYISKTISKIVSELEKVGHTYELIIINDGSTDATKIKISELKKKYKNIKSFEFLKNYGQHAAILCGIRKAKGKYLINIDDDLQNPPQEIYKLINKIEEGYDLVFANFKKKNHNMIKNIGSKFVNSISKYIFKKPSHIKISNFRIFTDKVSNKFKNMNIKSPYIAGYLLLYSNKISQIETNHDKSISAKSSYNLRKTLSLLSNIIFNHSVIPISLISITGAIISFFSFSIGIYYIVNYILAGVTVPGWTTLVVLLSFFSGYLILMLGILGQYLAKIIKQVSDVDPYTLIDVKEND